MNSLRTRQRLHQQIDQLPSDLLLLVAEFIEFLTFKRSKGSSLTQSTVPEVEEGKPILTSATGADLLQFVGTWQGDDFEECLESVYETRFCEWG
jgi:predicted XRE-type DNA-binding protein